MDHTELEIIEDEIKVLHSIFMENYSKQEIIIKRPWRDDLRQDLHSIKLCCDGFKMILNFKFTPKYPQEPPVLSLSECDVGVRELLDHINKQLPVNPCL